MIKTNFEYEKMYFSAGEMHIKILETKLIDFHGEILWRFEKTEELFEICLLADTFKRMFPGKRLVMGCSYLPFARQDRATTDNQPFSLKVFWDILDTAHIDEIYVDDLHSGVTHDLAFTRVVQRTQDECFLNFVQYNPDKINVDSYDYFVAPDKGAVEKVKASAEYFGKKVLILDKVRDPLTGQILKTELSTTGYNLLPGYPEKDTKVKLLILDDIIDGGKTFIKAAETLREVYPNAEIDLYITHGIFAAGQEIFTGVFKDIFVFNDMRKEKK